MKKIIVSLLAAFALCICASAQTPRDVYYVFQKTGGCTVVNANTGASYDLLGLPLNIGIDDNHNVYVLTRNIDPEYYCLAQGFTVWKNGKVWMPLTGVSDNQYYSSMAMKVVGNNVVVTGVEVKPFNSKGFEARLVGWVNRDRVFDTEWERKSLKREQFQGFCEISGSGTSAKVVPAKNFNSINNDDIRSWVFYVAAVDYVNGDIYATGWGEREYTVTPAGRAKQYLVRRCPRVWKNGKEIIQQYENRTGAAWTINVMRGGQNILTAGHERNRLCGWDGNKDMVVNYDGEGEAQVLKEAAVFNGMVDGVPMFTRLFIDDANRLYYVNTGKNGNQKPAGLVSGGFFSDVVVVGSTFYALDYSSNRICKIVGTNWMKNEWEVIKLCGTDRSVNKMCFLAVHN